MDMIIKFQMIKYFSLQVVKVFNYFWITQNKFELIDNYKKILNLEIIFHDKLLLNNDNIYFNM
jgi:hypothetical protein